MKRLIFVALLLAACGARDPAEQVAREFMDTYYVSADLDRASTLADGLALGKVRESLVLRKGQLLDAPARRPKITYRFLEGTPHESDVQYLFQVKVQPEGFEEREQQTRLTLREMAAGWKVTQFVDSSEELP